MKIGKYRLGEEAYILLESENEETIIKKCNIVRSSYLNSNIVQYELDLQRNVTRREDDVYKTKEEAKKALIEKYEAEIIFYRNKIKNNA